MACSTFSPARKVRSTTAPVRTFLQRGAHEGAALAGLHVLELDDLEEAVVEVEGHAVLEVVGGDRWPFGAFVRVRDRSASLGVSVSGAAPVGGDDDGVLDADATVLGEVDARLDGDDVAGGERSIGRRGHPGSSWMSRPTPWPVPWTKASPQPASAITAAAGRVDVAGGDARPHRGDAGRLGAR